MDEGVESSRFALKIVFYLSFILVIMDIFEIYYEYITLLDLSHKYDPFIFEDCIKYHILTQMFFSFFATLAGISATLMSFGLIVNYEFFSFKVAETFLYLNYMIFGPYLFAACVLAYYNFGLIIYNCDSRDYSKPKLMNFSTLLALIFCTIMSFILTFGFSIIHGFSKMASSISFKPEGNHLLGKIFWRYVFNRSRETIQINEEEMRNVLNVGVINDNELQRGLLNRNNNINDENI